MSRILLTLALLLLVASMSAAETASNPPGVMDAAAIAAAARPAGSVAVLPAEDILGRSGDPIAVTDEPVLRIPLQVPAVGLYRVTVVPVSAAPCGLVQGAIDGQTLGEPACASPSVAMQTVKDTVLLAEGIEILELRRRTGARMGVQYVIFQPAWEYLTGDSTQWLGVFDGGPDAATALGKVFPPEQSPDAATVTLADGKSVAWESASALWARRDRERMGLGTVIYLRTFLYVPGNRVVGLELRGPNPAKVWLAGKLVSGWEPETAHASKGSLRAFAKATAGWNLLLVKLAGSGQGTGFDLGVTSAGDVRFATSPASGSAAIARDAERANYAKAFLTNGLVKLSVYLPNSGYYVGPRFDWSGLVHRVEYQGHNYFDDWQWPHDPHVNDAANGTAEEFGMGAFGGSPPLGYDEAAPGETFVRVGVGVLLRSNAEGHGFWKPYKVVEAPPWEVKQGTNWIEFRQVVHGPRGWAYDYTKRITLPEGQPRFVIWHRLKNLGTKTIVQPHYCHNFLHLDGEPSGPSYVTRYAFPPQVQNDPKHLTEVIGNEFRLRQTLADGEAFFSLILGSEPTVANNDVIVTNTKSGARVRIQTDLPVTVMPFFATRRAWCPEPNVEVRAAPGAAAVWTTTYTLGG